MTVHVFLQFLPNNNSPNTLYLTCAHATLQLQLHRKLTPIKSVLCSGEKDGVCSASLDPDQALWHPSSGGLGWECSVRPGFKHTVWQRDAASFFSSRLRPGQPRDVVAGSREESRHVNLCTISAGEHTHTHTQICSQSQYSRSYYDLCKYPPTHKHTFTN